MNERTIMDFVFIAVVFVSQAIYMDMASYAEV